MFETNADPHQRGDRSIHVSNMMVQLRRIRIEAQIFEAAMIPSGWLRVLRPGRDLHDRSVF